VAFLFFPKDYEIKKHGSLFRLFVVPYPVIYFRPNHFFQKHVFDIVWQTEDDMKTKNFLEEMYPYDNESHTFTILLSIDQYADFYNKLDPSPVPLRDLAPDLVDYLNQCSTEIPNRFLLSINLAINEDMRDPQLETDCQNSLITYFKHETLREKSEIKRRRTDAAKYLAISFLCLVANFALNRITVTAIFWDLLREAVLIGGWVFMWEAITVLLIEVDKYVQAMKKFERLVQTKIIFTYNTRK
jgi:hypothetical protein